MSMSISVPIQASLEETLLFRSVRVFIMSSSCSQESLQVGKELEP